MLFNLSNLSSEPVDRQITQQFLDKLLFDDFYAGRELQSPRNLASEQNVSVNCAERAYKELIEEGLLRVNDSHFVVPDFSKKEKEIIRKKYYSEYSPVVVIELFSQQINTVINPEKLIKLFSQLLQDSLFIHSCFFIFNNTENSIAIDCTIATQINGLPNIDQPINAKSFLQYSPDKSLTAYINKKQIDLIIPLKNHDKLIGLLALTKKKNLSGYNTQDINTLIILANQFAAGFTTAHYYSQVIEKQRLDQELEMARQIQSNLLPKNLPDDKNVTVAAYSSSLQTVGGDFYDCFETDKDHIALIIADACGKGLPAAMLISQLQSMLRSEIESGKNVQEIMTSLNRRVITFMPKGKFVTLFLGIYNKNNLSLEFVNAGHNYPVLVNENKTYRLLDNSAPALGIIAGFKYQSSVVKLQKNASFYTYTDGITEAMNNKNQEFGEENLLKILTKNADKNPEELCKIVLEVLNKFVSGHQQHDDQTMLILKTLGH